MRRTARRLVHLALPLLLGASACLPYTVGPTVETVSVAWRSENTTSQTIPNANTHLTGDTIAVALVGVDHLWPLDIDERPDFGMRVTSGLSAAGNYNHRFPNHGGVPVVLGAGEPPTIGGALYELLCFFAT